MCLQSVIELSRTQDEEVGDGTTSVIILGQLPADVVLINLTLQIWSDQRLRPSCLQIKVADQLIECVSAECGRDPCFLPPLVYCHRAILSSGFRSAAGEMLQMAEPFLEHSLHPTVIIRGYVKALEDALSTIDSLAFPIDTSNNDQMLKIISSCIGTKFTSRFGTLMPVSITVRTPSCAHDLKNSLPVVFSVVKEKQLCHFYFRRFYFFLFSPPNQERTTRTVEVVTPMTQPARVSTVQSETHE